MNRWLVRLLLASLGVVVGAQASQLQSDERVLLFPTLGWEVSGGWELEIHGCVFEPEKRPLLASALRKALGIDDDELSAAELATWRERSQHFLVDNKRGKVISIQLGEQIHQTAKSAANGHFQGRIRIAGDRVGPTNLLTNGVIRFEIAGARNISGQAAGQIHLLRGTGLSVISDIDDTIKVSQVRDRKELLRNTFCRPFKPVPGMARVYQSWGRTKGAQFHYVSASPWQLYAPLSQFVQSNGFPAGTFHLKNFRVKDKTLFDLFESPEPYKLGVIGPLMKRFPRRRFVLVGDSGEQDPEVYATLARRYPKQVVRILIRDVSGETPDSPRYRHTFSGLHSELWKIFRDSSEIEAPLR